MKTYYLVLILFFSFISVSEIALAQWSSNPAVNLAVCDTTGEQALAKIGSTSDGGCYISWFDTRSGSYAVYLQRLDPLGNKLWAPNGLLVSSNQQSSSLVDWDLIVDANDNAVVAFTDTRNSGNLNPFVYSISPNGDFLWGANGIDLNPTSDFQANPKLAKTDDGNIVVAYEPIWAIGTGRTATTEQAQEIHAYIRKILGNLYGNKAEDIRILYGGSVTPDNVDSLMACKDVNGALVGGASLKPESFAKIVCFKKEN